MELPLYADNIVYYTVLKQGKNKVNHQTDTGRIPMNLNSTDNNEPSPIIFYYDSLEGLEHLWPALKERFRQTGHKRPIIFREYDSYKELPGKDGDLYTYDAIVLSALVDKGFFRALPESVSCDHVFPWVMEKSRVRRRAYGVPFMLCSPALICRKRDDLHVQNIMELKEGTAIPLRSMLMFYFVQSFCENLSLRKSFRVMEHLLDLIGGRDALEHSGSSEYDGINRFNREECRYLLAFTEDLHELKKDDYAVSFANFSDNETSRRPRFLADFISVGKQMPEEKLQDCLDLINILISEQFVYETCIPEGDLLYMLPADMIVFRRLSQMDAVYAHLYSQLDSEENGVLRYGKRFYENFYARRDMLLQLLWKKAGWEPELMKAHLEKKAGHGFRLRPRLSGKGLPDLSQHSGKGSMTR